ncbi:MAG: permease, partial [Microcystaceae cyanobacterium]
MIQLPEVSSDVITLFLSQIFLSFPFLLAGILVSSFLLVFVDEHKLVARFPRNRLLASLLGSVLGLILPVGQLGVIPIARRLLLQGAPTSLSISFLIAAPTLNFIVIADTLQGLSTQPRLGFLRLFLTWLMAMIVALIFSAYQEKLVPEQPISPLARTTLLRSGSFIEFGENSDPLHRSGNLIYEYAAPFLHKRSFTEKIRLFIINTFEESLELGLMVILTAAIAVAIQVFIPQSYFFEQASSPLPQTLLMMGWGFFVSLGSMTSITFIQPYL